MSELKKYRVIITVPEEHSELTRVYGDKIIPVSEKYLKQDYYVLTWVKGGRELSSWGTGTIDNPEIKPITFKEWKEDYYKSIEVSYEIY